MLSFSDFPDFALTFFFRKKSNKKALVTASSPIAIGYLPSTHSLPKNP